MNLDADGCNGSRASFIDPTTNTPELQFLLLLLLLLSASAARIAQA